MADASTETPSPLMLPALAFIGGAALGLSFHPRFFHEYGVVLSCAFGTLAFSLAAFRTSKWLAAPMLAAFFAFGFVRAVHSDYGTAQAIDSMLALADSGKQIAFKGRIENVRRPRKASHGELKYHFRISDVSVDADGDGSYVSLPIRLPVTAYCKRPEVGGWAPESGDLLSLTGKLCSRKGSEKAELGRCFVVTRERRVKVLEQGTIGAMVSSWRESAAGRIVRGFDDHREERDLVLAMTLGYRSELPRRLTRAFRRAGTIHIFAISGLHVGIIVAMLSLVLSVLCIPRRGKMLALMPLLAAYVYATGMQPSAMRAAAMVSLYCISVVIGRQPRPLNVIAASALLLLAIDPAQLRNMGFIMSFAMVAGLIVFCPPVLSFFNKACGIEEIERNRRLAVPGFSRVPIRLFDVLRAIYAKAVDAVAVSVVATLVSLPLTAYFFGFLSVYSFFANVVIVPLSFAAMTGAGLALLVSYLHPLLSYPFAWVAIHCAGWMRDISVCVSELPSSSPEVALPLWLLVAYYAVLLALAKRRALLHWRR